MTLALVTPAPDLLLTTRTRVKATIPVTTAADDAVLDELIDAASAAIHGYCNRERAPFGRQAYTETLGAYGDIHLMLKATPVVLVSAVLQDGAVITDFSIEDADAGLLYRQNQWFWTAQVNPGLTGRQIFPAFGSPIAGAEEPRFSVSYVAGWLLPSTDLVGVSTISASSVDNSFSDSASKFPELAQPGDFVTMSSFANGANNGRFVITGTPTRSKIQVTSTLTTEAAGAVVTARFRNIPQDLERACIETVKNYYFNRGSDSAVTDKGVMGSRMRFFHDHGDIERVPPLAAALLRNYKRAA